MEKTLIIILGETRAYNATFDSFIKHLVDPLVADVALCVANNEREHVDNPFYKMAKYKFITPEYNDWGDGFEDLYPHHHDDWKKILNIKSQWLGGIRGDGAQEGSGGIQIFFRAFLKKCLADQPVHLDYDRIIITRSDFKYDVPHVPLEFLSKDSIWVPDGEHNHGINDRHIITTPDRLIELLSIAEPLMTEPDQICEKMSYHTEWNIEKFLKFSYLENQLFSSIQFFPYTMYTVREPDGHTSWSTGEFDEELGLFIKYLSEKKRSDLARSILNNEPWSIKSIKKFTKNNKLRITLGRWKHNLFKGKWEVEPDPFL